MSLNMKVSTDRNADSENLDGGRAKLSNSCKMCQRRRIKCDRKVPICSSCKKRGETNLCEYESSQWQENAILEPGNARLRKEVGILTCKIKSLEKTISTQRRTIDIMKKNSRKENSESNIQQEDKNHVFRVDMVNFHNIVLKNLRLTYFGPTTYIGLFMNDKYGQKILNKYSELQRAKFSDLKKKIQAAPTSNSYPSGPVIEDISRISNSLSLSIPRLPLKESSIRLIERFFQYCYPFVCFLNKDEFIENISLLWELGSLHEQIQHSKNYEIIASLLIVLRFSTLTFPSDCDYKEFVKFEDGEEKEITPSYIEYASTLLLSPTVSGRINLRTIEALLLLRVYKSMCPEDDTEATDNTILLTHAINMSIHHGLPLAFKYESDQLIWKSEKDTQIKIWLQLLYDDASNSFNFGLQPSISNFHSEGLVSYLADNEIVLMNNDFVLKQIRVKSLAAYLLRKITLFLNGGKGEIQISDLEDVLDSFENLLNEKLLTFSQLISMNEVQSGYRVLEFILRIEIYSKLFILYYCLFLIWDKDLSLRYSKSIFLNLLLEKGLILSRLGLDFAARTTSVFGAEYDKIIGASILSPLTKVVPTLICFLCRSFDGNFNFTSECKKFKSSDSFGLGSWAGLDFTNNVMSLKNTIEKYKLLYLLCIQLYEEFFIAFKVGICLQFSLDFVQNSYYELLINNSILGVTGIDNFANDFEFPNLENLPDFNSNDDLNHDFDYNLFLSFLKED
ncbi:uncharacterized protein PRCAT00005843001 [Priceomyces carsonii]|uniref:uncharacterized protein n=1 Tax=Priceomyces carsonii TaxID=28549 RepID=UPI002EDA9525|nr:unnamed protein product [Priceomyces carsonii]